MYRIPHGGRGAATARRLECNRQNGGVSKIEAKKCFLLQTVEKGVLTPWPPLRGGSARRRWGERTVRLSEIFRAMARFSPSAPSGHLPRRGRFFDRLKQKNVFCCFCMGLLKFGKLCDIIFSQMRTHDVLTEFIGGICYVRENS